MTNFDYIAVAKKVLEIESKALTKQIEKMDEKIQEQGRIIDRLESLIDDMDNRL